ncbi:TrmH family RNA methyltransferase [Kitasatospora viridis]|uniref:tRNA (Guanosine-2'-O-)-methyltransferase n=1 Tax=Kitasatospora viridis TaxID=281105 RepID=A0A561UAA9_9ACTN|nr:TrmH family RNA methyltransferase [Kitasatospora viridis]TWF96288.1 tRNA (guanosine-2'-O-)-methyltransferase [Kitasatospora viridis]
MQQLGGTDLKRLHRTWRRRNENRLAVLLEHVESPFNVGSIVRTAAAMGAESLYLAGRTPDVQIAGVRKVSMGTDRYLSVQRFETFKEAAAKARADGYRLVALELADESVPLPAARLDSDVCLVVGHEDRGVSAEALNSCDAVVFVPQLGKVGSLNVATALAVGCYEVRRQGFDFADQPAEGADGTEGFDAE